MRRVILHMAWLVLKGFRHEDQHAHSEGLREKSIRIFAEPDTIRHLLSQRDLLRLKVNALQIKPEAKPSGIGTQAARGIAREIK
jgi:hypothetical protein